ncbi:MAG TPA: rhomboid family intramembrane serine protease [Cytophagales bacterium]|nr:rhomboid family intramembrane serine protease [Cytophagales bacterium]
MTVTILILLVTLGLSFYAWNNESVMYKLVMDPYSITKKKQYYRLLTSGFIHADYIHLFFNMFALWGFGMSVEYQFVLKYGFVTGEVLYLLFYLAALIASDLPTYLKNKNNYNYSSLGASGAVSALILSRIIFDPISDIYLFFFPLPGIIMGVLYIAYSYHMGKQRMDNIGHDAHLHGALFGIVATIVLFPSAIITFYHTLTSYLF